MLQSARRIDGQAGEAAELWERCSAAIAALKARVPLLYISAFSSRLGRVHLIHVKQACDEDGSRMFDGEVSGGGKEGELGEDGEMVSINLYLL